MDDIRLPFTAIGYVLRSPYPHAKVNGVNADTAKEAPGVVLVLTGADAEAQGLGTLHCHVPPMAFGGPPSPTPAHPILARDRVRCVGDPVAFVVAETLAEGLDAVVMIVVNSVAVPAVGSTRAAVKTVRHRYGMTIPAICGSKWTAVTPMPPTPPSRERHMW